MRLSPRLSRFYTRTPSWKSLVQALTIESDSPSILPSPPPSPSSSTSTSTTTPPTILKEDLRPLPFSHHPPDYRSFKPASRFSIYKMSEIQRSVDNAAQYKLIFFSPLASVQRIKEAIFATGAGTVGGGRHTHVCFQTLGTGQFKPGIMARASPRIRMGDVEYGGSGGGGRLEVVEEVKCEIICPGKKTALAAVRALLESHPYEVPAYEVYKMEFGFQPGNLSYVAPIEKGGLEQRRLMESLRRRRK